MRTGFPRLGVLRRLRPTRAFGRRHTYPRPATLARVKRRGTHADGSHVHCCPVNGLGTRLYPAASPRLLPQAIHRGLRTQALNTCPEFPARHEGQVRTAIQPESTGLELARGSRGVTTPVPRVYLPSRSPRPAHPAVPSRRDFVEAAPVSPVTPGSDCLQLHPTAAAAKRSRSSTSIRKQQRLVAHSGCLQLYSAATTAKKWRSFTPIRNDSASRRTRSRRRRPGRAPPFYSAATPRPSTPRPLPRRARAPAGPGPGRTSHVLQLLFLGL